MQMSLVMMAGWMQWSSCREEIQDGVLAPVTSRDLKITSEAVADLQICGQGHVDFLSIGSDSVEQEGVVQGAVPHRLKAIESPERKDGHRERYRDSSIFNDTGANVRGSLWEQQCATLFKKKE